METRDNTIAIILVLIVAILSLTSFIAWAISTPEFQDDVQVAVEHNSDQVKVWIEGLDQSTEINPPLAYTLKWDIDQANNCYLSTEMESLNQQGSEIIIKPELPRTRRVNTIDEVEFNIDIVSDSAKIIHKFSCDNRLSEGALKIENQISFRVGNQTDRKAACKYDFDSDGTLEYDDLGPFALKYLRDLPNCSQDITGNDCKLDEADLIAFKSIYNVPGACN